MKILKFGGSSIQDPEHILRMVSIIKPAIMQGPVGLVFSAFGGVTDTLITISDIAFKGDPHFVKTLEKLEKRHIDIIKGLLKANKQGAVLTKVKLLFNQLEDVLNGVYLVREKTYRTMDYILSFGERLSNLILAEVLDSRGIPAVYVDARELILTDDTFSQARVDFPKTDRKIRAYFKELDNRKELDSRVPVITGFIAASDSGYTTTLGRSGSDYTASIIAGAIKAESLEIWTDVDGVMTADPRRVRRAFKVPSMSYAEAMELSHFGAKVVFPATMRPAMEKKIPIYIKNTLNPENPGTLITSKSLNGRLIKGISSLDNISLLSIQGAGMVGVVGVAMRLFTALARERINIILISQASSEHSICIAVESGDALRAKKMVEEEFRYEIKSGEMEKARIENELAVVAIVGDRMQDTPGTSGRMFGALGRNGINVVAIAQGSSERNISVVVQKADVSKALNALHESFFLSDKKVLHLFMAGTGLIGKALLKMIRKQFEALARENLLEIHLVGISNSRKMLFDEDRINPSKAIDRLMDSGETMDMKAFFSKMISMNLSSSIFVDCTASEAITRHYQETLEANISIVTPNKKANSGPYKNYEALRRTAFRKGSRFFYETNVGAGLPVISTLEDLMLSGDKVIRLEAVLSGTLNFIFSSFKAGKNFSEVVREAREKGYTEPDPRDDLNGMDVARKILILARETGWRLEIKDVAIENLVPKDCRGEMGIDDFFSNLSRHDAAFETKRLEAEKSGKKLRYSAVFENGKAVVGLKAIGDDHPFFNLNGSDNILMITTQRYLDLPMVIRGPGAGAEVTAAGVFADIIRIRNYARHETYESYI